MRRITLRQLQAIGRKFCKINASPARYYNKKVGELIIKRNCSAGVNSSYFVKYKGYEVFVKNCEDYRYSEQTELNYSILNEILGFSIVPKTILVPDTKIIVQEKVSGRTFARLEWVTDRTRKQRQKSIKDFLKSQNLSEWIFLDGLFYSSDRHSNNMMYSFRNKVFRVWLIDNGFSLHTNNRYWDDGELESIIDNHDINNPFKNWKFHPKTQKSITNWLLSFGPKPFTVKWKRVFLIEMTNLLNLRKAPTGYNRFESFKAGMKRIQHMYKSKFTSIQGDKYR